MSSDARPVTQKASDNSLNRRRHNGSDRRRRDRSYLYLVLNFCIFIAVEINNVAVDKNMQTSDKTAAVAGTNKCKCGGDGERQKENRRTDRQTCGQRDNFICNGMTRNEMQVKWRVFKYKYSFVFINFYFYKKIANAMHFLNINNLPKK